jgi:hypothetical protein
MFVFRDEILWPAVQIRKIAPPATRDQDLPSRLHIVFEQQNPPSALASHRRTHQASRTGTQNNHIELARSGGHGKFSIAVPTSP